MIYTDENGNKFVGTSKYDIGSIVITPVQKEKLEIPRPICTRCGAIEPAILCTRFGQVCAYCNGEIIRPMTSIKDLRKELAELKEENNARSYDPDFNG